MLKGKRLQQEKDFNMKLEEICLTGLQKSTEWLILQKVKIIVGSLLVYYKVY